MQRILLLVAIVCLYSCKKTSVEDVQGDSLRISILPVSEFGLNAFKLTGSLEIRQVSGEVSYGLLVGKSVNPTEGNAKSYVLGKSLISIDFSKEVKDLDTGSTYYVRAYAKRDKLIEYSSNQVIAKVSPQILRADTSLNYGRAFTIFTNIVKLDPLADVQVFLDNQPVTVKAVIPGFYTTSILAEFSDSFKPGKMTLSVRINNVNITVPKKVTLLTGLWKPLVDLPTIQSGYALSTERILVGDWIYALGLSQQSIPVFNKYNFLTGQLVQLSAIPEGNIYQRCAIVNVGNEIHIISGVKWGNVTSLNPTNVHFVYNIERDTWRKERDFPGVERSGPICFLVGGKIYFGMGVNQGGNAVPKNDYLTDMWSYDPSSKIWKQLGSFPEAKGRFLFANFLIGSKIYLTGGVSKTQYSSIANKESWCYDTLTDQWAKKTAFPGKAEISYANFTINEKGYVGLGESATYDSYSGRNLYSQVYQYDPIVDKWEEVGSAPELTGNSFSASYGTYAIMGAGVNNSSVPKNKLFSFYP